MFFLVKYKEKVEVHAKIPFALYLPLFFFGGAKAIGRKFPNIIC